VSCALCVVVFVLRTTNAPAVGIRVLANAITSAIDACTMTTAVTQAAHLCACRAHVAILALANAVIAKSVVIATIGTSLHAAQIASPPRGTQACAVITLAMERAVVLARPQIAQVTRPPFVAAACTIRVALTMPETVMRASLLLAGLPSEALLANADAKLLARLSLANTLVTTSRVAQVPRRQATGGGRFVGRFGLTFEWGLGFGSSRVLSSRESPLLAL